MQKLHLEHWIDLCVFIGVMLSKEKCNMINEDKVYPYFQLSPSANLFVHAVWSSRMNEGATSLSFQHPTEINLSCNSEGHKGFFKF